MWGWPFSLSLIFNETCITERLLLKLTMCVCVCVYIYICVYIYDRQCTYWSILVWEGSHFADQSFSMKRVTGQKDSCPNTKYVCLCVCVCVCAGIYICVYMWQAMKLLIRPCVCEKAISLLAIYIDRCVCVCVCVCVCACNRLWTYWSTLVCTCGCVWPFIKISFVWSKARNMGHPVRIEFICNGLLI